jgi:mono/diheme cytochrome c family protein
VGPAKVACADCHLIADPRQAVPDDLIRPGHNLFDAFGRGTWWNGRVTTDCGEAAEVCFKRFMGGEELDGRARTALVLFMKGRAAPVSNPMILHRVPPGRAEVSQGDAARGRDLFRRACAICHSAGDGPAGPDLAASSMTAREIADVVRTGRNRMPLFQGDVLSDADVADLAVYTRSLQPSSE